MAVKKTERTEKKVCTTCNHLESARDYWHDKFHEEENKNEVLCSTIAILSKDLSATRKLLETAYECMDEE